MHLKIKPWNIKFWGDSFGGIHPHHAWMDSGDKNIENCTLLSIVSIHYEASVCMFCLFVIHFWCPIEFCDHYYVPQSECDFLVSRLLQTCWGSRLQFRKFGFGEKSWFQKIRSRKKVSVLISKNLAQKISVLENLVSEKISVSKSLVSKTNKAEWQEKNGP